MIKILLGLILLVFVGDLTSQKDPEIIKGTFPKLIIQSGSDSTLYYFNPEEKLDSVIYFDKRRVKKWIRIFEYGDDFVNRKTYRFKKNGVTDLTKKHTYNSGREIIGTTTIGNGTDKESLIERRILLNIHGLNDSEYKKVITKSIQDTFVVLKLYEYEKDTLLSRVLEYSSRRPIDANENVMLTIETLDKFEAKISRYIEHSLLGDTLFRKIHIDGNLFGTEKLLEKVSNKYFEFDYVNFSKQIEITEVFFDTIKITNIQYNKIGDRQLPKYKIVTKNYENGYISEKINLMTNEIQEDHKMESYIDKKGNWITRKYLKNGELTRTENREIIYY